MSRKTHNLLSKEGNGHKMCKSQCQQCGSEDVLCEISVTYDQHEVCKLGGEEIGDDYDHDTDTYWLCRGCAIEVKGWDVVLGEQQRAAREEQ